MRLLCEPTRAFVCSPEGKKLADDFREREAKARHSVEAQVLGLLKERRAKDAAKAVAAYEIQQVFPRGLGIDWANGDDPGGGLTAIEAIFEGVPKILAGVGPEELEVLCTAAAASLLGAIGRKHNGLLEGFSSQSRFADDVAVRMVLFYGQQRRNLEGMKGVVKKVRSLQRPTVVGHAGRSTDESSHREGS